MSQSRLHGDNRPLTPARTSARGQMHADEPGHDRFVEISKRHLLFGEPVRKVSNGVEIGARDRAGIPVPLQIRDLRGATWTQHAR